MVVTNQYWMYFYSVPFNDIKNSEVYGVTQIHPGTNAHQYLLTRLITIRFTFTQVFEMVTPPASFSNAADTH